jgi:hypothetical protein
MKRVLIALVLISTIAGCASHPKYEYGEQPAKPVVEAPVFKLKGYEGPNAMENAEVVQASKQCIYAKLRPNVEYVSVKVDTGGKVLVPVNVHCEPY